MTTVFVKLRDKSVSFFDGAQGINISGDTVKAVGLSPRVKKAIKGGLLIKLSSEEASVILTGQLAVAKENAKEAKASYKQRLADAEAKANEKKVGKKPNFDANVKSIKETLKALDKSVEDDDDDDDDEHVDLDPVVTHIVTQEDLDKNPGLEEYLVVDEEIPFADVEAYLAINDIKLPDAIQHTLTEVDFENNPELAEKEFKVGDVVDFVPLTAEQVAELKLKDGGDDENADEEKKAEDADKLKEGNNEVKTPEVKTTATETKTSDGQPAAKGGAAKNK